jgi:hypothetical protein
MILLKNVLQCSFSCALKYILCVCVHLRSKKKNGRAKDIRINVDLEHKKTKKHLQSNHNEIRSWRNERKTKK